MQYANLRSGTGNRFGAPTHVLPATQAILYHCEAPCVVVAAAGLSNLVSQRNSLGRGLWPLLSSCCAMHNRLRSRQHWPYSHLQRGAGRSAGCRAGRSFLRPAGRRIVQLPDSLLWPTSYNNAPHNTQSCLYMIVLMPVELLVKLVGLLSPTAALEGDHMGTTSA